MLYYLWVVIDLDSDSDISMANATSYIQNLWDYGIAGNFTSARFTRDEIILCVERNSYEDFDIIAINAPDKWGNLSDELIVRGIGGREVKAFEGDASAEISPRLMSEFRKLLKSEIQEAKKEMADRPSGRSGPFASAVFRVFSDPPRPGLPSPESLFENP